MQVVILYNSVTPLAEQVGAEVSEWLTAEGIDPCLISTETADSIPADLQKFEFLIVLGGDGTTLRAARLAAHAELPIFGINMGRVGFLSEAEPDNWQEKIRKVLRNEHWLEQRLMLRADVMRQGQRLETLVGLNDIVVSRSAQLRMLQLHLFVDDDPVTVYMADAIIAATPTGSTAYSMAAGGPVLPPQLQNFLVLPVAPHLSFEEALVLHEKAVIMVRLETPNEAVVTADGQDAFMLQGGDEVIITRHQHKSLFIRLGRPGYFYRRLMEKLNYWSAKPIQ